MEIVSTGQMRAQSISVQVSSREVCNGRCKYCISRLTPGVSVEEKRVGRCSMDRLKVGLNYAKALGATHAILTGKADPTQERPEYIYEMIKTCREYLPLVDFHTNGLILQKENPRISLENLAKAGLTQVTYSIASFDPTTNQSLMGIPQNTKALIKLALRQKLMVRCSLVMCKPGVENFKELLEYIRITKELGAHAVVVREIWIPDVYEIRNREVFEWNKKNQILITPIQEEFLKRFPLGERFSEEEYLKGKYIRNLPWGVPIFDIEGINVTFARCEESYFSGCLKCIVHKSNGHGYMDWDHEGSILY